MPRGRGSRGGGHKGQRRHFTNPEALERDREKEEREKRWRQQKGDADSDEEEEGEDGEKKEKEEKDGSNSSEESESEDEDSKAKGVQHLIDIQNPNRAMKKNKKVETLTVDEATSPDKQQLSRREREELEKQKARAHYMKMHAAGKTEEAREDLARLALIRKQREEMAKKRDDEKKTRDAAKEAKSQELSKALGKKT